MVGLLNAKALVWLASDFWQAHFQMAFGLFQAETFYHIDSDAIFPRDSFSIATYGFWCTWTLLPAKYTGWLSWRSTAKTFQACICL